MDIQCFTQGVYITKSARTRACSSRGQGDYKNKLVVSPTKRDRHQSSEPLLCCHSVHHPLISRELTRTENYLLDVTLSNPENGMKKYLVFIIKHTKPVFEPVGLEIAVWSE